MAYAALVSLAQTIHLILNHHEKSISRQIKDQIISINEHVILLQAFLEEFPDKAKANRLEERIRDATHAAEDGIEFLMSKSSKHLFGRLERGLNQIRSPCCGTRNPMSKHQTWENYENQLRNDLHDQNKVTEEIESIAEEVREINNSVTVKDVQHVDSTAATSSSRDATVRKEAIVGFGNDLMEIKLRLCGESSKLEVIPIAGMGGIGKTTLAKNVYDDPLIMERFEIRAWVTVSHDYRVHEIVSYLLKVFNKKNESMEAHDVYQHLKNRRYLIVLDDLWSVKAWDDLMMMFPDDGNGSRIVLTTRLSDVASYPDSYRRVHEMRLMDRDQSWELLKRKVFKGDHCPVELEDVGKMISSRCGGLPLAIVVISGILSTVDRAETAWKTVAENVISASGEHCDEILSLSYAYLPHYLRPCFLYMGGFPEDREMRVSKLIKLWVAEGFLKQNGSKSFEETAEEYLEDLVKRSLVLVTVRKSNGGIKRCSMHDLTREMCIRKAQEQNFVLHVGRDVLQEGRKAPRRLSIYHSDIDFFETVCGSTIRTMILLNYTRCERPFCLGYFRLLRILDLSDAYDFFYQNASCRTLPVEVFELLHLRYLALHCNFRIPPAISNLRNLQTLIITGQLFFRGAVDLPEEIWGMPQLRHLVYVCSCNLRKFYGRGAVFALENLQTLSMVRNFICTPEVLKMIPNLKKLGLSYTELGEIYGVDYQLYNLIYLQQLEILELRVGSTIDFRFCKPHPVFPTTLKKLSLYGLRLRWKYMKIVGSLPELEVLKLRKNACDGHTWETNEGEFPQLKFLLIEDSHFEHWITESSHFQKLECLVLRRCSWLRQLPDCIGEIPTLKVIEVSGLKSLADSAKRIQEDQLNSGNDALQVRVISWGSNH